MSSIKIDNYETTFCSQNRLFPVVFSGQEAFYNAANVPWGTCVLDALGA